MIRASYSTGPNACPMATAHGDLDGGGCVRDDRVQRIGGRAEHGVSCLFPPVDRAHGRSRSVADDLIDRSLVPAVRPGRTDADPDLDRSWRIGCRELPASAAVRRHASSRPGPIRHTVAGRSCPA